MPSGPACASVAKPFTASRAAATLTPVQRFGSQPAVEDEKKRRFIQHKAAFEKFRNEAQDRRDEACHLEQRERDCNDKIASLERNGRAGEVAVAKREKADIWVGKKELLAAAKEDIGRQKKWDDFLAARSDEPGW